MYRVARSERNSVFSGLGSDLSVGRMVRGEDAWVVCVCISYPGGEGQLGCNFLWSGGGDWGQRQYTNISKLCLNQSVVFE